jgi:hypothetical protein
MVITWPYLWFSPITRFMEVVTYFTTVGQGYQVAWNGMRFMVGAGWSLWWYPIVSFVTSLPLLIVVSSLIGVLFLLFQSVQSHQKQTYRTMLALCLLWLFIPLIRIISPTSAYYDGFRHFIEILPVIAMFSAVGTWSMSLLILKVSKRGLEHKNTLLIGIYIVIISQLLFINMNLFPYSSGFLNMLVSNKNMGYDREYSGLAIKEGMNILLNRYDSFTVWVPIGGHLSWYYIRPGKDQYVYTAQMADSIVYINKYSHSSKSELEALLTPDFKMIHEIKKGNDVFGWVYRREY